MKTFVGLFATALLVGGAVLSQVVITSLDRNGALTWTNSVSNATYRVEWASSATGAWQDFGALSNLLSLHASTNVVTVRVPMLYRVVWTDAPPPDPVGRWQYWAYCASSNTLCATGLMTLWWTNYPRMTTNMTIGGTWEWRSVPGGTNYPPFKETLLSDGRYLGGAELSLVTVDSVDSNTHFDGSLAADNYRGTWQLVGGWGILANGSFTAQKIVGGN